MKPLTLNQWVAILCDLMIGRPDDTLACHMSAIIEPLMRVYADAYEVNYGTAYNCPHDSIRLRYLSRKNRHYPGSSAQHLRTLGHMITWHEFQPSELANYGTSLTLIDALMLVTKAQEIGNAALSNQIQEWADKRTAAPRDIDTLKPWIHSAAPNTGK